MKYVIINSENKDVNTKKNKHSDVYKLLPDNYLLSCVEQSHSCLENAKAHNPGKVVMTVDEYNSFTDALEVSYASEFELFVTKDKKDYKKKLKKARKASSLHRPFWKLLG